MKRKAVAAVLTAVMVASMFTGCGSDNGSSSAKSASAASAASAANDTVDEDGKVNGIMYQEGLPLVDEGDYTFSIFCDDSSESGEFIMLDEFKKQTNVDVDLKIYPGSARCKRKNDSTGRTHLHDSVRMRRYNRWIQPIHQYEMAGKCWHEHADHHRRV